MESLIVPCRSCGKNNRIPDKKQHLRPRCGSCKQPLDLRSAAVPVRLGDDDFQTFVDSAGLPVVVDMFSPGCGPCRSLAPVIARCASRFLGRVIVAVYDTSRHQRIAARYHIKGVPTLLFFRQGREVDRIVGAPSEQSLIGALEALAR
ncbi:thioredoxin family protein [Desulfofustis limnaeus]|jgi:thioredoxin 2|uniref:Thiol disulfide reductase thioredoxin n=1 Tax=Desulfofustis limnaeus TaxID=2740163 RepID=A0ABN6M4J2_9BACT|nr:thioredoxin family protein [Desulfofustis limnaeus]MDX9895155.1 thioredoxin family protein [Desulfofustis sp.]BDD86706.1 thiol disulfide reductase thioredoxin [Desulfofustis limnaeus]